MTFTPQQEILLRSVAVRLEHLRLELRMAAARDGINGSAWHPFTVLDISLFNLMCLCKNAEIEADQNRKEAATNDQA